MCSTWARGAASSRSRPPRSGHPASWGSTTIPRRWRWRARTSRPIPRRRERSPSSWAVRRVCAGRSPCSSPTSTRACSRRWRRLWRRCSPRGASRSCRGSPRRTRRAYRRRGALRGIARREGRRPVSGPRSPSSGRDASAVCGDTMRRLRFLVAPGTLSAGAGAVVALPGDEARHLARTLRAQPGLDVQLFDGEGEEWTGVVVEATRGATRVRLVAREAAIVESPLRITVFQALSLERVFEESLEPLTALGVSAIVPLLTERSRAGRQPDAKRLARWRRIAAEACKLSFRRVIPAIGEPVTVTDLAATSARDDVRLLLDPDAPAGSLRTLIATPAPPGVGLAVGPEGGFTTEETARLVQAGFAPVRLGPRVLRTQHAGAAAVAILLAAWSDVG